MVILAQGMKGLTARLSAIASRGTSSTMSVLLDGPYGGIEEFLDVYDRVVLFGGTFFPLTAHNRVCMLKSYLGGAGASFIIPLLEDLAPKMSSSTVACKSVRVIWAIRDTGAIKYDQRVVPVLIPFFLAAIEWFDEALRQAISTAPVGSITVDIFVTGLAQVNFSKQVCLFNVTCLSLRDYLSERTHQLHHSPPLIVKSRERSG